MFEILILIGILFLAGPWLILAFMLRNQKQANTTDSSSE